MKMLGSALVFCGGFWWWRLCLLGRRREEQTLERLLGALYQLREKTPLGLPLYDLRALPQLPRRILVRKKRQGQERKTSLAPVSFAA